MSACRSGARYPPGEFSCSFSFGGSRTIASPGFSTPRFPWTHTRAVFPAPQRRSNPFGIATSPIKNFGHDVGRFWGGVVAKDQGQPLHLNSPHEQNTRFTHIPPDLSDSRHPNGARSAGQRRVELGSPTRPREPCSGGGCWPLADGWSHVVCNGCYELQIKTVAAPAQPLLIAD